MANRYFLRQRVALKASAKTVVVFGGLGMITGAFVCATVLFVGQNFNSEETLANKIHATISAPQQVCLGESVSLQATGGDVYFWTPTDGIDDPRSATALVTAKNTTKYTATVYKKIGHPLRQSGMLPVTATLLNSKDKTLHRAAAELQRHQPYLITFQARTENFLDKATVQVRVNGKAIATCDLNNRFTKPQEWIWENHNAADGTLTLHLLNYDGDGENIECNVLDMQAVDKSELTTLVTVDKNCTACPMPTRPMVINESERAVKLQWGKSNDRMLVRFKRMDEDRWKTMFVKNNTATLKELSGLYDYEAQLATICKNDTSDWTESVMLLSADRLMMSQR